MKPLEEQREEKMLKKLNLTNSLSLKDFLMQSRYEVPWYQRNYAWESKQLNDLIDDIQSSIQDEREHFFGIIMTMPHKIDPTTKRIIDGQQRITTTLLYLKAIEHLLSDHEIIDKNNEYCEKIIRNIQGCIVGDMSTIIGENKRNRLSPTIDNKEIFDAIFDSKLKKEVDQVYKSKQNLAKTNINLYRAYEFLYNKLELLFSDTLTIEKLYEQLFSKVIKLLTGFIILPIEVQDQIFAYQFFQTVNDRGNDLTITDILKAYFFELSDDDKIRRKKVYDSWNQFTNNLGNVQADTFLRHYWLSKIGVVNTKDLLSELKHKYTSYEKAIDFLKEIKTEAENYRMLTNHEVSNDKEKAVLDDIFELAKAFVMPPILAGFNHLKPPDFITFTKLITVFVFRYRTISHLENKNMEKLFSDIAIYLRREKSKSDLNQIKQMLEALNPTDDSFNTLFSDAKMTKNSTSKYILESLEKYYRGSQFGEWDPKMSVEHILPKNNDKWEKFCKKEEFLPERYVNRIGNLTLVTQPLNSKMKNSFFDKKKEAIKEHSNYKINEFVVQKEKWNHTSISERQKEWGRIASKIWNLDSVIKN
jgi:uncharacterized protein with ParB-like and HNH nuclease domain